MMRKLTSPFLAAVMLITLFAPFSASASYVQPQAAALQRLEEIAYLDINAASQEMQKEILDARNILAYTKEWVADGCTGWVEDINTGEIIRYLPSYSEVFPGWDLPVGYPDTQTDSYTSDSLISQPSPQLNEWRNIGSHSTYLEAASDEDAADPFVVVLNRQYTFRFLRVYASELTSSKTCNIGFTDGTNLKSLGYATYLAPNEAFSAFVGGVPDILVRASTYSIPGWATMEVDVKS